MSGPYGPNDPDERWTGQSADGGRDESTRAFNTPPPAGQQAPGQQWGQQPPSQQWPGQQPTPGQQWGQQQPTPQAPNQQWGQQPTSQGPVQQWGQQPPGGQAPGQSWGQQPYGAGQQQYPPQYGGSSPRSTAGTGKKSKLPLIIGGVVAVLVLIAIGIGVFFFLQKDTLDQNAAQDGVRNILTESYGAQNVTDVSCPSGQEVKKDATFTCTVNIDGEDKSVTVTFTDDEGTYEVGRPN